MISPTIGEGGGICAKRCVTYAVGDGNATSARIQIIARVVAETPNSSSNDRSRNSVGVDIAVVERDCATRGGAEATSVLRSTVGIDLAGLERDAGGAWRGA